MLHLRLCIAVSTLLRDADLRCNDDGNDDHKPRAKSRQLSVKLNDVCFIVAQIFCAGMMSVFERHTFLLMPLHHISDQSNFIRIPKTPPRLHSEQTRSRIGETVSNVGSSVRVPTTGLPPKHLLPGPAAQPQRPEGKLDTWNSPVVEMQFAEAVGEAPDEARQCIVRVLGEFLRKEAHRDCSFKQDLDSDERRIGLLRTKAREALCLEGSKPSDENVGAWCATVDWLSRQLSVTNSPRTYYEHTKEEIAQMLAPYTQAVAVYHGQGEISLNFICPDDCSDDVVLPAFKITKV